MVRSLVLATVTALLGGPVFAQESPEIAKKFSEKQSRAIALRDSLSEKTRKKLDRMKFRHTTLRHKSDSLRNAASRLKPLPALKLRQTSLTAVYQHKMDSLKGRLASRIDSLSKLQVPTADYSKALDSLNKLGPLKNARQARKRVAETEAKVNSKVAAINNSISAKLKEMELNKDVQLPGSNLNLDEKLKIPGSDLNLPKNPLGDLPKLPVNPLGNTTLPNKDLNLPTGNLPNVDLPNTNLPNTDLGKITQIEGLDKVKEIAKEAGDIKGEVKDMDAKKISGKIEDQVKSIDEVGGIANEGKKLEEMKGKIPAQKGGEEMKDMLKQEVKEQAVDHFKGKEQVLMAAMDKVSKLKMKYPSIKSLSEIPKRPPNPMKGKPFIERLVPGIYFMYQREGVHILDLNPYVGYRLSGRLTAGAGWNHRISFGKSYGLNTDARVYGPRAYADYTLGKGFIAHAETELLNTFVPPYFLKGTDAGDRQWVWGMMTGLKKEYKIARAVRGTVLFQYNLFDRHHKAPYLDRVVTRFGFEFKLRKKQKKDIVIKNK